MRIGQELMKAAWLGFAIWPVLAANGEILRVDPGAGGGGDGTSWEAPFSDLQSALAVATAGDEIWLKAGTYLPSETSASVSFVIPAGVSLYGGFAGVEALRDQRDWSANVTALSGDIGQDDVVGSGSGWYLSWNINTNNSGHVVEVVDVDGVVLDGLLIEKGHTGPSGSGATSPFMHGSGLYAVNAGLTVRNCTFRHCIAAFGLSGGAVFLWDTSAVFQDCTIKENFGHLSDGAGMFTYGTGSLWVEGCTFRHNIYKTDFDNLGAGLTHYGDFPAVVRDCVFDGNTGQGFYSVGNQIAYGGGLCSWIGGITVDRCLFKNNRAHYGAGFMAWGDATITNSVFVNNTATVQPADPYPEIGGQSAAIAFYTFGTESFVVDNCTIMNNTGKSYAVATYANAHMAVDNSILWGNVATHPERAGTWKANIAGSFDLSYSNVEHIFEPDAPGEDPIDPENLPGCVSVNPMVANIGGGNYALLPGSPCIDAGDNAAVPAGIVSDYVLLGRFFDDPNTADTGSGSAPIVDMGAVEFRPAGGCAADFNGDGLANGIDIGLFLQAYAAGSPSADMNSDGQVNGIDVGLFLSAYAAGC